MEVDLTLSNHQLRAMLSAASEADRPAIQARIDHIERIATRAGVTCEPHQARAEAGPLELEVRELRERLERESLYKDPRMEGALDNWRAQLKVKERRLAALLASLGE
jgi:hypothetical protein